MQRGDIMLVTLVFLLVCLLALVVSMRDGIVTTLMTGNTLARQKDVHVGDIALGALENSIVQTAAGQSLYLSASTKNWYRAVAAGTAIPGPSYWTSCSSATSSTSTSCGTLTLTVNGTTLPYKAYGVVQETGAYDEVSCGSGQIAVYYALFVHVQENNGATAVNTETVYKLCTLTPL